MKKVNKTAYTARERYHGAIAVTIAFLAIQVLILGSITVLLVYFLSVK